MPRFAVNLLFIVLFSTRIARRRVITAAMLILAFAPANLAHAQTPTQTPVQAAASINIDFFKKRLLYYRCTAYEHDIAAVLGAAQKWVAARAPQVKNPAIVLDIDETSLLNWPRIYQDDYAYFSSFPGGACSFSGVGDPCGDLDWQQSGVAVAIAPTLALYKFARCIDQAPSCSKIDVFFVTGRREIEHNHEMPSVWTLRNLANAGYGTIEPDHLYMRDPGSSGSAANHKIPARANIESKGFTIIASIGDQKSDLCGGHAEMTFKVPNPFYFIP
jgi:predicted secreted acid phosphatase